MFDPVRSIKSTQASGIVEASPDVEALRRRVEMLEDDAARLRAVLARRAIGETRDELRGGELHRHNELQLTFAEFRERLDELSRPWPIRALRSVLRPRLDLKWQHAPRVVNLPARYETTVAPDPAPRISIVTPVRDQHEFIEATIGSVIGQRYPNLQYIVRDGRSRDGTLEIVRRHAGSIADIRSEADSGQTNAINRGFEAADGEIMAWLNGDDLLCPGSLAYVARFFVANPDVDIVYGHRVLINREGHETGRWILPAHDATVLRYADYVPQETLFWRRRVWRQVGPLDESFQFAMDWDFLLRAQSRGMTFARLPRFLGCFRVHDMQKSSVSLATIGRHEMDRLRRRELGRPPDEREMRRRLRPYLLRHAMLHRAHEWGMLRP